MFSQEKYILSAISRQL